MPTRSVRACGNRSKTGCTTCKARRVKCDEGKPDCQRCQLSNRVCSYAPDKKERTPTRFRMVIYTAPQPYLSVVASLHEKESLDYFLTESRGRFPLEFSHSVLRAVHKEPVLAHAIRAFGALQWVYEFGEPGWGVNTPETNGRLQFATREYGKALGLLQARTRDQNHEVTLICSVLFACFECLRGCRRAAIIHIASGLNLLRQMESDGACAWRIVSWKTIRGLFTRLDSQLVEVLGVGVGETLDQDGIRTPESMGSIVDVVPGRADKHQSLDELLSAILREKLDSVVDSQVSAITSTSSRLISALEAWHSQFARSESNFKSHLSDPNGDDAILHVWYLIGKMYLIIRPSDPESAWDQFTSEFELILSLCETYITESKRKSATRNQVFSFSLGVIPPLFITAQRCRNSCIRRRAIFLLSTCGRRELVWDSALAAEAAQRVMEIEESAMCFDAQTQQPVDVRVRTLTAILDDEDGARVLFQ